jgi:hypothetical protein
MFSLLVWFKSCLVYRRWLGVSKDYLKKGRQFAKMVIDWRSQEASEYKPMHVLWGRLTLGPQGRRVLGKSTFLSLVESSKALYSM